MRSKLTATLAAGFLVLCATAVALVAQSNQAGGPQNMPPLPKPGPEHAIFNEDAGTWDAVVETFMSPGAAPAKSKAVETDTIGCGGLCLITDFKGEMMGGVPFHGHGTTAWDPKKKKYVSTWTDSMSLGIAMSEGTWDPVAKTITGWMEGPDASGQTVKMRSVSDYKVPGTRVFTMYGPGPDGKEMVGLRITYTRRK